MDAKRSGASMLSVIEERLFDARYARIELRWLVGYELEEGTWREANPYRCVVLRHQKSSNRLSLGPGAGQLRLGADNHPCWFATFAECPRVSVTCSGLSNLLRGTVSRSQPGRLLRGSVINVVRGTLMLTLLAMSTPASLSDSS